MLLIKKTCGCKNIGNEEWDERYCQSNWVFGLWILLYNWEELLEKLGVKKEDFLIFLDDGLPLMKNMLAGKGVLAGGDGVIRASERQIELVKIFNAASSFS